MDLANRTAETKWGYYSQSRGIPCPSVHFFISWIVNLQVDLIFVQQLKSS